MRKMARVVRIDNVTQHGNADALELAVVGGWQVVIRKGEFKAGDLSVLCEIDSFVPTEIAAFLTKEGKEPKEYNGVKGERLRTIRLRGELSQGLLLPVAECFGDSVSISASNSTPFKEGDDVSEALNIQKWEPPVNAQLAGQTKGNFPSQFFKTDQERIQNLSRKLEEWIEKGLEFEVTEKLEGCFLAGQLIETWGGSSVKIIDIVNGKLNPDLIGVNENGEIVPCQITKTFKNGTKKRWVDIIYKPYKNSNIVGKSGKLRTTPNHKIFLSDMAEVDAVMLKSGDKILMQTNEYCEKAIHYFNSSLLGDGSIGNKNHYSYNEAHSEKHNEFSQYIEDIFSEVPKSTRAQISGKGSLMNYIKIFSTEKLKELRNIWYPSSTKKLPEDISWIDDFSVAKWYMDDGSLSHSEKQNDRANFSTQAFEEVDVRRLATKLNEMYGVDAVVYYSRGWTIRVNYNKGTIHNMWTSIAKHIPPSMRYKLPEEYRDVEFEHYGKVSIKKVLIPCEVLDVTEVEHTVKNFPYGSAAYDIETTTHNYFCGGVLVHNSSMTCYLLKDGTFGVCSRNLDLKRDENNTFWNTAIKLDIEAKMKKYFGENPEFDVCLQGELIGEGVQKNIYKVKGHDFRVFDIQLEGGKYFSSEDRLRAISDMGLDSVPVIFENSTCKPMQEMLKMAEGDSRITKTKREGLVWKCLTDSNITFKVINNSYLLSEQ